MTFPATPASQALSRPRGVPEKIGAFDVRGAFRWEDMARILLGFDPVLGRQVVLWLRHRDEPALSAARREINRTTRLRWLAAGPFSMFQWDGFVAPGGCPLPALIEANGPMHWGQVQPLLLELTDELLRALREGTVSARLDPNLVWVRPDGQMILVDMPLTKAAEAVSADEPAASPAKKVAPVDQALDLLARVAVLSLEGRPPPQELPANVRAPLPLSARTTLHQLLDFKRRELPLNTFRKRLAQHHEKPLEVSRGRRAVQLAVMAVFMALSFGCFFPYWHFERLAQQNVQSQRSVALAENAIEELDRASLSDFLSAALNPDPLATLWAIPQLEADARLRQELQNAIRRTKDKNALRMRHALVSRLIYGRQEDAPGQGQAERLKLRRQQYQYIDADYRRSARSALAQVQHQTTSSDEDPEIVGVLYLLPWPLLWVLWAFVLPGGLSYLLARIALVRSDGRPAGRWQAAWRAFLIWAPLGALLVVSALLADWYWSHWGTESEPGWALSLSTVLWWCVWVLLAVYAILALRSPRRSLLDRLTRSYVVPR